MPARIGAPVFIVQHMPPHFTEALARGTPERMKIVSTVLEDKVKQLV